MPRLDVKQTTYTDMSSKVEDYEVEAKLIEGSSDQKETFWDNDKFVIYNGYYKTIPELKKAIDAYATWVLGKGYTARDFYQVQLDKIKGWGEDTFNSILWNMIVMKKVNGDAYAEIIRNENGTLINLKPLDPSRMRVVVNGRGIVKRYEYEKRGQHKGRIRFEPSQIFHICNDRVADEIHGSSVIECVQWVIDARNEAMRDLRRILHRSTIRVMEIDEDDKTRMKNLKSDYAEAIQKGELLLVPKGTGAFQDLAPPQTQHIEWIRYLENFFYQAVGIPKVILGGSEEFTEASSKISYLTYEQIYTREVVDLEADLWNQLGIKITFIKPASLKNEVLSSEQKNTGQVGFQPNDTQTGLNRGQ